jgi:uncharacterized protein DUF5906
MVYVSGPVREIWDAVADKGERSKRDFRLVLLILRAGATEDQACRLLYAMPGSKAAEDGRGSDYWAATLASVRRHMETDDRHRVLAEGLPEDAKDDPGAPFSDAALDSLLWYRNEQGADEWQRLRANLKKSKISVRALEDAMLKRSRIGIPNTPLRYVAEDGRRVGWFAETNEKGWVPIDGSEARASMRAQGQDPDCEIQAAIYQPWSLVNEPFQAEELPGRLWNKDGARLAYEPKPGSHPTWDRVLANVGHGLDGAVLEDEWCVESEVRNGATYLFYWVAALFQTPKERTAFLFFYGEQEAGKSTFHEAVGPLLSRGYVRANHAIRSKDGFNGEIANAILCVIEEIDLSDPRRETHERVKDWVTGKRISVRALYCQAYDLDNHTHWVHCANKRHYMAAMSGDTRVTSIYVQKVADPEPKEVLLAKLAAESPAFLYSVLHAKLPPASGRLRIPALDTRDKREQTDSTRTDLEEWLETRDWVDLEEEDLIRAFLEQLPKSSQPLWDRGRVARELSPQARRLARLAKALRERIGAPRLGATDLLGALPALRADWPNGPGTFGRALHDLARRVKWLRKLTVKGMDYWEITK